ncbi:MAG: heat-inducible transcriptional repressor HrcA [bacterium]
MELELTGRECLILNAVIEYYIIHAEPIGSRTLSKKISSAPSPATIRNIMADLEEIGLLQHPHTSAGRIPTDNGYRYYVDNLLKTYSPLKMKGTGFESLSLVQERKELMEEISKRLSSLSRYVGLILAPKVTDLRMKHMDFILLSSQKILAVFISKTGWVYNKIIEVKESYSQEELDLINRYINAECEGLTLSDIRDKLIQEVSEQKNTYKILFENINLLSEEIYQKHSEDLYLQGLTNIIKLPDFADLKRIKLLFKALEKKIKLVQLLDKCIHEEGLKVTIGSENEDPDIQDCSIVMTCYHMGSHMKGALGIIGPTRMRYTEVISIVDYAASIIKKLFHEEET